MDARVRGPERDLFLYAPDGFLWNFIHAHHPQLTGDNWHGDPATVLSASFLAHCHLYIQWNPIQAYRIVCWMLLLTREHLNSYYIDEAYGSDGEASDDLPPLDHMDRADDEAVPAFPHDFMEDPPEESHDFLREEIEGIPPQYFDWPADPPGYQ